LRAPIKSNPETIANRLDVLLGPENWTCRYYEQATVLFCEIVLTLPEGEKVAKSGPAKVVPGDDGATARNALISAAWMHGIGRRIVEDDAPVAESATPGESNGHAEPGEEVADSATQAAEPAAIPVEMGRCPTSGKNLLGWLGGHEKRSAIGVFPSLCEYGRSNGYPAKVIDWQQDQIVSGYRFAVEKFRANNYDPLVAESATSNGNGHATASAPQPIPIAKKRAILGDAVNKLVLHRKRQKGDKADRPATAAEAQKVLAESAAIHPERKEVLHIGSCQDEPLLDFTLSQVYELAKFDGLTLDAEYQGL
jgi:hypothetical protein